MTKITSEEFEKQPALYRALAQKEVVVVTKDGHDACALLGADEYARYLRHKPKAYHPWELPRDVIEGMGRVEIPEESKQFDHEYKSQHER